MQELPILWFLGATLGFASACGSKTLDGDPHAAGGGGTAGNESGGSGAKDPTGGDAGTTSGSSGSAGRGAGGTGRGGSGTGGNGAGESGTGGSSGRAGAGGSAAGAGGSAAGAGGSAAGGGGAAAGSGGAAAGAGGSLGGTGGCGICQFVACAPSIIVTVTAPADIAGLHVEATNESTRAKLGGLTCYAGNQDPCTWTCQLFQLGLSGGDYSLAITAPGYEPKAVDFTVVPPANCGCCGCMCTVGYQGTVELEPDGSGTPECCSTLEEGLNCGSCGHACDAGIACVNGECVPPS